MVDWNKYDYVKSGEEGMHVLMRTQETPYWETVHIGTPTEALLKTLCSQEGVTPCNP
jgi:hypothetical protein